ncbi:MAG: hypothetical protein WC761_06495 [Candidatus Paceibacterota bacterium]|jgi:hypothetical protein
MIEFIKKRIFLKTVLVFSFFFLVFFALYFSVATLSSGDDHFFHFRFAETMTEKGFFNSFTDFKALYFSKMAQGNDYFVYYNFLFYLAIIPLTVIAPLFLAIKLYGVIAASLVFTIFFWCLERLRVKGAFLWTAIIFAMSGVGLIARFMTSRPFTLAPALLLLQLYFLHKKKYLPVLIVTLIYFFWHSATFYFPLGITFIFVLFEAFYGKRISWKSVAASIGGLILGLLLMQLLSTGFIYYIYDIIFSIYTETILGKSVEIPEGAELYKADIFDFIRANAILMTALIISVSVFVYRYIASKKNKSVEEGDNQVLMGASFFLSISFFLGTVLVSRRFQDYFTFFAGLFVVLSFSDLLPRITIADKVTRRAIACGLLVSLCYLFSANVLSLQSGIATSAASPETFKSVGEWLNKNAPKDSVIFNASWNWFPQLYYHSPDFYYIAGLEPRFLYVYDKALYWKWAHITHDGYVCITEKCPEMKAAYDFAKKNGNEKKWYREEGEKVAEVVQTDFQSSYIVTSKGMIDFNALMDGSERFEKVHESTTSFMIYRIK